MSSTNEDIESGVSPSLAKEVKVAETDQGSDEESKEKVAFASNSAVAAEKPKDVLPATQQKRKYYKLIAVALLGCLAAAFWIAYSATFHVALLVLAIVFTFAALLVVLLDQNAAIVGKYCKCCSAVGESSVEK